MATTRLSLPAIAILLVVILTKHISLAAVPSFTSTDITYEMTAGDVVEINLVRTNCDDSNEIRNVTLSTAEDSSRYVDLPKYAYNVPCINTSALNTSLTTLEIMSHGAKVTLSPKMVSFVTLVISDVESGQPLQNYSIGIVRPQGVKDKIFLYGIICMSIFNTLCFGLSLDLQKVKGFLKKPISPGIGLACQFILMPMIGFVLTQAIDRHPSQELGVFAAGVAPGGGGSNIWSYLLGGDIDLSITMTFISSIFALAFIPLWMYTLGRYIIGDDSITLPVVNMVTTLLYITVPVGIGLVINRFLPKVKKVILKAQKPVIAVTILFAIIMGIYANLYAFKIVLFDYQLALSGMLLPYGGGLIGLLIGLALRRPRAEAFTIAIETAIQNTTIATILLRTSLPQPWADISTAVPICLNLFIPLLFQLLFATRMIYIKCCKRKQDSEDLQLSEDRTESPQVKGFDGDDNSDSSGVGPEAAPPDYTNAVGLQDIKDRKQDKAGEMADKEKLTEL